MLFKKRTSILQLWSKEEVEDRARDFFAFTLRNQGYPRPGVSSPEIEESYIGASIALCCVDAFKKLKNRDIISMVESDTVRDTYVANWTAVAECLLASFKQHGYTVTDDQLIESYLDSLTDSVIEGAKAAGWEDKTAGHWLVKHLQRQSAYQQLSMEIYNDAMAKVADNIDKGDEVSTRGQAEMSDTFLAAFYLLPASEKKVSIFEAMLAEHEQYKLIGAGNKAHEAFEKHSRSLALMTARARLQQTCIQDWIQNPSAGMSERMTSLDEAETLAIDDAIGALNNLISSIGLSREDWLNIVAEAFNEVRRQNSLPLLSDVDMRARLLQGFSGGRARFFN